MAEITQKLGFEAADAIATLNELNGSIGKVNTKLRAFNKATAAGSNKAEESFNRLAASARAAKTAMSGTATQAKQTGQAGARAGQQITASWETMVRVVGTQALVRALNLSKQLFSENADAAETFQLAIARTAAIAKGPAGTIDALSESVRELAIELGRPVDETATAAYEALQNDLGGVEETLDLVGGAAQDLALVTGGSLLDSVNTLSSVMKIFRIDVEDADHISDILFRTVDAGRVTLDDLANSLGSVGPFADQLGITFEQMSASIAAITLQGVDSAKALTQMRGITNALLKPTSALKKAYDELGVASGKELVEKTGGLVEALQALEGVANGNEVVFKSFFGRIRASAGALNILNDDASNAKRILNEYGDAAGDAAEEGKKINEIDARKSQLAFSKLRDTMLGLGESFQVMRTAAVQAFNVVISNTTDAQRALTAVGISITALAARVAFFKFAFLSAFAVVPATLAVLAVGVTAGFAVAKIIEFTASLTDAGAGINEVAEEARKSLGEDFKKTMEEANKTAQESYKEREEFSKDWVSQVTKDHNILKGVAEQANSQIVANAQSSIDSFVQARQNALNEMRKAITDVDKRILDSTGNVNSAIKELEDFKFERGLQGLNSQTQAAERLSAATKAAGEARKAAAKAGTSEQAQSEARALQGIAKQKAQAAVAAAEQSGNIVRVREAQDQLQSVLEQNVNSEKSFRQNLQNFKKQGLEADLQAATQRFQAEKALADQTLDLLQKVADASGNEPAALIDQQNLAEASSKLQELLGQDFNVDLFKQMGTQSFIDDTTVGLLESFSNAEFQFGTVRESVQRELDRGAFSISTTAAQAATQASSNTVVNNVVNDSKADVSGAEQARLTEEALVGVLKQQREVTAELQNQGQEASILKAQLDDLSSGGALENGFGLKAAFAELDPQKLAEFKAQIDAIKENTIGADSGTTKIIQQRIDEAKQVLLELTQSEALTTKAAENGLKAIETAQALLDNTIAQTSKKNELISQEDVEAVSARLEIIRTKIREAVILPEGGNTLQASMKGAEESAVLVGAKVAELPASIAGATTSAAGLTTELGVSTLGALGVKSGIQAAGLEIDTATSKAKLLTAELKRAAQQRAAAGGGQSLFHGGKVNYRAAGGPITRGQDNQLTALSVGESVINARSTRKFASEIQAMNAGQRPQFRENGGTVTNVGDINVSISSDSARGVSGREIAVSLRRELRRNTSQI